MRRGLRGTGFAAIALGLLAPAACAPRHEAASHPTPPVPTAAAYATIVSIRPMLGDRTRGAILGALGGGVAASTAASPESEFIIRDDGGRTVSVVQSNLEGLRNGEHVLLIAGAHTRLARPSFAGGPAGT